MIVMIASYLPKLDPAIEAKVLVPLSKEKIVIVKKGSNTTNIVLTLKCDFSSLRYIFNFELSSSGL